MAGLVPAIHAGRRTLSSYNVELCHGLKQSTQNLLQLRFVDGRDKPGHDATINSYRYKRPLFSARGRRPHPRPSPERGEGGRRARPRSRLSVSRRARASSVEMSSGQP